MPTIPTSVGAITLFVDDLEQSKAFYSRAFGLDPVYEDANSTVFKFENTLVNVLTRAAAPELVEPATIAAPGAGPTLLLTIWVEDTDAACAELEQRGVELLNGPMDRAWGVRTAAFSDPSGHVWELAQQLG